MEMELKDWKADAEKDYINTPISVLRYIMELEKESAINGIGFKSSQYRIKELEEVLKIGYVSVRHEKEPSISMLSFYNKAEQVLNKD